MKTTLTNRRDGAYSSRCFNSKLFLLTVGAIFSCFPAWAQSAQPVTEEPDFDAAWPEAENKGLWQKKAAGQTTTTSTTTRPAEAATTPEQPPKIEGSDGLTAPPPMLKAPKATKHEISVSGDIFLGDGNVTLPLLYSLSQVPGIGDTLEPTAADADRTSTYYGATLSYSFGQAWYFDLAYARGDSSGTVDIDFGSVGGTAPLPSNFTITDNWYQAYVKYTFPALRGKRLSAYLRAGVSFVQADLTAQTQIPALGLYNQTDKTTDVLGNFGFGVGYRLYTAKRFRLGLQLEGEGFYGTRSQDSLETLDESVYQLPPSAYSSASIDNTLYGGIGRATVHMEYRLGQSGLMKVFLDGGLQGKFTQVEYPDAGSFSELLWGPYGKLGFSYSF